MRGGGLEFSGENNGFCGKPPIYEWSVVSNIASTVGEGNTANAMGYYHAGKGFISCDDEKDTTVLRTKCKDASGTVIGERVAETEVTVKACEITIDPQTEKVKPEDCIEFRSAQSICCENPPVYTWSVNGVEVQGNTTDGFMYQAGRRGGVTEVVEVTDTANDSAADSAQISVTSTTTSIVPQPPRLECRTDGA